MAARDEWLTLRSMLSDFIRIAGFVFNLKHVISVEIEDTGVSIHLQEFVNPIHFEGADADKLRQYFSPDSVYNLTPHWGELLQHEEDLAKRELWLASESIAETIGIIENLDTQAAYLSAAETIKILDGLIDGRYTIDKVGPDSAIAEQVNEAAKNLLIDDCEPLILDAEQLKQLQKTANELLAKMDRAGKPSEAEDEEEGMWFECDRCHQVKPASEGQDDSCPNTCDDCWGKIQRLDSEGRDVTELPGLQSEDDVFTAVSTNAGYRESARGQYRRVAANLYMADSQNQEPDAWGKGLDEDEANARANMIQAAEALAEQFFLKNPALGVEDSYTVVGELLNEVEVSEIVRPGDRCTHCKEIPPYYECPGRCAHDEPPSFGAAYPTHQEECDPNSSEILVQELDILARNLIQTIASIHGSPPALFTLTVEGYQLTIKPFVVPGSDVDVNTAVSTSWDDEPELKPLPLRWTGKSDRESDSDEIPSDRAKGWAEKTQTCIYCGEDPPYVGCGGDCSDDGRFAMEGA